MGGELLGMMKSPPKLVKGDMVGVVELDMGGVSLPSTKFGLGGLVDASKAPGLSLCL